MTVAIHMPQEVSISQLPPGAISQIRPSLFLSGYDGASDLASLRNLNITHIVNATCEYSNTFPADFEYLHLSVRDNSSQRLAPYFPQVFDFVNQARVNNGRVLIHCREGISRSATLVLAYLMQDERTNLRTTFHALKAIRAVIEPNSAFLHELRRFEQDLGLSLTEEKLTSLDKAGDEVEPSLEFLLQWMSLSATDAAAQPSRLLVLDFVKAFALQTTKQKIGKVQSLICSAFDAYATREARDIRARAVLPLAIQALVEEGYLDTDKARKGVSDTAECDQWADMDLPYAKEFLEQLVKAL